MGLFLGSLFCSFDLCLLIFSTILFDYCSFVVWFEIGKGDIGFSNFFFFLDMSPKARETKAKITTGTTSN